MIHLKRAYDPARSTDGTRLLIERLWPRGVKKSSLRIKSWLKDVAPKHGTSEVVQSRSCQVEQVPQPPLCRTEKPIRMPGSRSWRLGVMGK